MCKNQGCGRGSGSCGSR